MHADHIEYLSAYETAQTADTKEHCRCEEDGEPPERVSAERPIRIVGLVVREKGEVNVDAPEGMYDIQNDAPDRVVDGEEQVDETCEEKKRKTSTWNMAGIASTA